MGDTNTGTSRDATGRARGVTRRGLVLGGAGLAAAGAAAAVVGTAQLGGAGTPAPVGAVANASPAASTTPSPAAAAVPIAEPRRRAAHLLRRAGFGGSAAEIEVFAELSREEGADRLLGYPAIENSGLEARLANSALDMRRIGQGMRWWMLRMAYTARPLEERMTLFWHGLLTSQTSKVGPIRFPLMLRQNALLRAQALGRYDDLLQAVSKDPAMMVYLDTATSTAEHPNENYPRELLELFSMGVGNYTEDDVREAARAFTGWRLTRPPRTATEGERYAFEPQFEFQGRSHDNGMKTFLGQTGAWGGEDIVRIIMEQPATGRYICRRLFEAFAYEGPTDEVLDRLVTVWDASDHSIRAVVRAILVSEEFNSERAYRATVRSPVEFVIGAIRGLEIETSLEGFDREARAMDQVLFEPPSVAGWPGGEAWLSSSTFFARVNFLDRFLSGRARAPIRIGALDGAATAEELVDRALSRLVDGMVPEESREAIYAYARSAPVSERAAGVAYLVLASPAYQLV